MRIQQGIPNRPFNFFTTGQQRYLSTRRNGWFTIELSEVIKFPGPSVLEPQNPLPLPGKSFFKCAVSWRSSGIGWRVLTWMIKCWKQPAISKPIICVSRQVPDGTRIFLEAARLQLAKDIPWTLPASFQLTTSPWMAAPDTSAMLLARFGESPQF